MGVLSLADAGRQNAWVDVAQGFGKCACQTIAFRDVRIAKAPWTPFALEHLNRAASGFIGPRISLL
jgi:hypothetical protein